MNIYSKNGDKGTTNLVHTKNVSKSDDRVRLFGDLDELNSYLGLVKTMIDETDTIRMLEKVQMTLLMIMDGVADPFNREYKVDDDKTELLEEEISRLEELFPHSMEMRLPGQCRLSAEIDVARTVARRAERALAAVSVKFGADNGAKKYMNRLADYLYTLARYADAKNSGKASAVVEKSAEIAVHGGKDEVRPNEYVGSLMDLCQNKRGVLIDMKYMDDVRVDLHYALPLGEIVYDFFDAIKSRSRGYASYDYEFKEYRESDLVKLDFLLNGDPVDALSMIVFRDNAYAKGRRICEKLRDNIPRNLFEIPVQAAIGGKIIARETVKAMRKDVLAKCYGGDISRKKKLLEKQKEGKKKMRQLGSVSLPSEAFTAVLKLDSDDD